MSQPLLCAVCFGIDSMEQDGETGDILCALCGSLSQQFREEDAEVWGAGGAGGTAFFRREANVAHHRLQELKKAARKEQEAAAKSIPEQAEALCQHYCRGLQRVLEAQCEALRAHNGVPAALPQVARSLWLQTVLCSRVAGRGWPGAVWTGEREKKEGWSSNRQARVRSTVRRFARQAEPLPSLAREHAAEEGRADVSWDVEAEGGWERKAEGPLPFLPGGYAAEEREVDGTWEGWDGEEEEREEPMEEGAAGEASAGEALEEGEGAQASAEGVQEGPEGSEVGIDEADAVPAGEAGVVSPGAVEHVGGDERATVSDEWKGMMRELGSTSPLMLIRHQLRRVLPLSTTLSVLFLACHWLRLPLQPWDLCRMASRGRLPFWRAWEELHLEAFPGFPAPLSARVLFMPHPKNRTALSARALELAATSLARSVLQMELRQVNAFKLGLRFLRELGLSNSAELRDTLQGVVAKADGLFHLCTAPEQLPARVLVMAAVLLALKLHWNLGIPSSEPPAPGPSSSSSWLLQRLLVHLGTACPAIASAMTRSTGAESGGVSLDAWSKGSGAGVSMQSYLQQVSEGPLGLGPQSGNQVTLTPGRLEQGGARSGDRDGGAVQGCLWGAFCEKEVQTELLPPLDSGLRLEAMGGLAQACLAGRGPLRPLASICPPNEWPEHPPAGQFAAQQVLEQMRRASFVLATLAEGAHGPEGVEVEVAGASLCPGTMEPAGKCLGYVMYARSAQRVPLLALHADLFVALHACARLIGVHERALLSGLFALEDRVLPYSVTEDRVVQPPSAIASMVHPVFG